MVGTFVTSGSSVSVPAPKTPFKPIWLQLVQEQREQFQSQMVELVPREEREREREGERERERERRRERKRERKSDLSSISHL